MALTRSPVLPGTARQKHSINFLFDLEEGHMGHGTGEGSPMTNQKPSGSRPNWNAEISGFIAIGEGEQKKSLNH